MRVLGRGDEKVGGSWDKENGKRELTPTIGLTIFADEMEDWRVADEMDDWRVEANMRALSLFRCDWSLEFVVDVWGFGLVKSFSEASKAGRGSPDEQSLHVRVTSIQMLSNTRLLL